MSSLIVSQSPQLKGRVRVSGAKNAVLPIIAASLLTEDECLIEDIPLLEDVYVICELLKCFGSIIEFDHKKLKINNSKINNFYAPYELVSRMRASFLVMGSILAKYGFLKISLPGGCAIGTRPIDLHLKGLSYLGAEITLGHGYIEARADKLIGNTIYLDFPSVGATENLIMAAVYAEGVTVIENAAEEPEIVDLANFINVLGGKVKGAGTGTIKIEGVRSLHGGSHTIIPDRIEAGTFMVAVGIAGGDILIDNVISSHLKPVEAKLREAGLRIIQQDDGIRVVCDTPLRAIDIKTLPYPGFPTDMQAQIMALLCNVEGTSIITETVFENRFMHVDELKRLGANIKIEGSSAVITGVDRLKGAQVKATDLRAGAALVLAGLAAKGETKINDIYHIDRGYEKIEEKLSQLGASVYRVD